MNDDPYGPITLRGDGTVVKGHVEGAVTYDPPPIDLDGESETVPPGAVLRMSPSPDGRIEYEWI